MSKSTAKVAANKVAANKVAAQKAPQAPQVKERKSRFVVHPAVASLGKGEKLTAIPADFDFNTHRMIRKSQFDDEALFYELLAGKKEHEASQLRARAEEIRTLGSKADRAAARQLAKLKAKYEAISAKLAAQGLDPEALMEVAMRAMQERQSAKTA